VKLSAARPRGSDLHVFGAKLYRALATPFEADEEAVDCWARSTRVGNVPPQCLLRWPSKKMTLCGLDSLHADLWP
jgi:hypothetical protein